MRYTWEQLTSLEEIPQADVDRVRAHLVLALSDPMRADMPGLFEMLLAPFYDHLFYERMGPTACHIVYRLSDPIPKGVRRLILVTPHHSLEEWRQDWVQMLTKGEESIPFVAGKRPELP